MNFKTLKRLFRTVFVCLIVFSFWAGPAFCQIIIGSGNGSDKQIPIGGASIVAALGLGYAIKKLWDRKANAK